MKKLLLSLIASSLLLFPGDVLADTEDYIVSIKDGVTVSETFERKYHLTQLTTKDHGLYTTDEANAAKIENHPAVEKVAETNTIHLSELPNDPFYADGTQWYLNVVNAPYGWALPQGQKTTVVVIDTGFDFNHEDKGNIFPGRDFIGGGEITKDYFTHGTACAGIIGAATDNGLGIAGLADRCDVIVINIFKENARKEATASDADVIAAIYSAVDDYHADVISMSFGGVTVDDRMEEAVKYATDRKAILVAATGNAGLKGSPYEFPASYDQVIGVANMNSDQAIDPTSTRNESVYITAPGTNIYTLSNQNYTDDSYLYFSGTSLATPQVAALAALAKTINPDLTAEEFKYYLRTTGKDLETKGYDIKSGFGLIDFEALLQAVAADQAKTLEGDGSFTNPYILNNEEDLRLFCLKAAKNPTACAKLNADITVSPAFSGVETVYRGTFNGNGYCISGLDESIFYTVGANGGVITSLTVNGNINNDRYNALIATENHGVISNCHAEGSIHGETAAGICGVNTGTVTGCSNRAAVSGVNTGGISAVSYGGWISQCYNHGKISSVANRAGGICAYMQNSALTENCYNTGSITGTNATGGIANNFSNATVNNCYYAENSVAEGASTLAVCKKSADYMKTKGFVCMLNQGKPRFNTDNNNTNGGYPVLGSSDYTAFFRDVLPYQWYADAVYDLAADKILEGREDYRFVPETSVTRAEFVTILAKMSGTDLSAEAKNTPFKDVTQNQWFAAAIHWAYEQDLAKGKSENQFCPNDRITRQEISAFLTRYLRLYSPKDLPAPQPVNFKDKNDIADWAQKDTALLTTLGVINGFPDGTFRPNHSATRGEAAQLTRMMRTQL